MSFFSQYPRCQLSLSDSFLFIHLVYSSPHVIKNSSNDIYSNLTHIYKSIHTPFHSCASSVFKYQLLHSSTSLFFLGLILSYHLFSSVLLLIIKLIWIEFIDIEAIVCAFPWIFNHNVCVMFVRAVQSYCIQRNQTVVSDSLLERKYNGKVLLNIAHTMIDFKSNRFDVLVISHRQTHKPHDSKSPAQTNSTQSIL